MLNVDCPVIFSQQFHCCRIKSSALLFTKVFCNHRSIQVDENIVRVRNIVIAMVFYNDVGTRFSINLLYSHSNSMRVRARHKKNGASQSNSFCVSRFFSL